MRTCWPFIRWPMPAAEQQSAGTGRRTAHPPRVPWEHGASNRKSHTPAARSNARRRGVLSGPVWLSPRVRGSWRSGPKLGSSGDHPRVCGEKLRATVTGLRNQGSPPRVRGKDHPESALAPGAGITPACAGKRLQKRNLAQINGDHPRVCGEKRAEVANDIIAIRITPACAGKSRCARAHRRRWWDHPRVCGEKRWKASTF